jgi:mRNA-degrading endonuclease RelE of RelBE toxin-antitoxin system
MVLFEIRTEGNHFRFYAIGASPDHCELLEFLNSLGANYEATKRSLLALFDKISLQGPLRNTEKSHKLNDIWEFIQGDLRIFYFYDKGRLIICTHGVIKRGRKIKRGDIERAENLREEYLRLAISFDLPIILFSQRD